MQTPCLITGNVTVQVNGLNWVRRVGGQRNNCETRWSRNSRWDGTGLPSSSSWRFAFMCSIVLWKTRSVIGTRASGQSLNNPNRLYQH